MRIAFITIIIIYCIEHCFSHNSGDYCDLFQRTLKLFNENTLYPVEPDKFDIKAFQNDFLRSVDPYSIIFSVTDLHIFDIIQQAITDDFASSYCTTEDELLNMYSRNIESTVKIFEKLKASTIDFNQPDSVYFGSGFLHATLEVEKERRCRQYLKSIIIQDIISSTAKYDSLKKDTGILLSYIDSIKTKQLNMEIEILGKILDTPGECRNKVFSSFMNSFIIQYDPYAYLFSDDTFSEFKEQLSSWSDLFGFRLETNEQGDIIVASVIPGSSAWKTGMINPGDKVLKLEVDNKNSLDLENAEMSDIIEFLSNITNEKLTITILKANRTIKTIDLIREKLENMDNAVQSFILQGKHKVGYIILPAFYTSWERQDEFGCAQDVGRAIYMLKKENIESLIIDLRNNGGGSIVEAIDLAGIFVDYGTLSVSQNKFNELISMKDFNRGTLYSGPMAVLINSNSASASEMVAAVLQDYNRAIIIGDTTFGKATGQMLLPLDQENKEVLKFTTNKYYRVTGKTYHLRGVTPDIVLPGYSIRKMGEKMFPYPNYSDTISRKTFYKPLAAMPKESLERKSRSRRIVNPKFQKLQTIDSIYTDLILQNIYLPLDFDNYYKLIRKKESIDHQLDGILDSASECFTVKLLPKDQEMRNMNKYYSDLYEASFKSILTDPYIEETLNIMNDYIHLKKIKND